MISSFLQRLHSHEVSFHNRALESERNDARLKPQFILRKMSFEADTVDGAMRMNVGLVLGITQIGAKSIVSTHCA